MDEHRRRRAASFSAVADAYDRARPDYPDAAVRWLAGDSPRAVVDLGAGTGKLTRSLAALGHRVTAVEPLAEMRDRLSLALPGVTALAGSAEAIPLADDAADVVVVAQAFHWFDHDRALAEIARVLRPGGRLAVVWNVRDETEPWVAELSEAMLGRTDVDRSVAPIEASNLYGPVEHLQLAHAQELDREGLRALVVSRSCCAILPEPERAPILAHVDRLFREHARGGSLRLPYRVECWRAVLA